MIGLLHNNLWHIIRCYKGRVKYESRQANAYFSCQSRYQDHIIRIDQSFYTISKHIINNPLKWLEDELS